MPERKGNNQTEFENELKMLGMEKAGISLFDLYEYIEKSIKKSGCDNTLRFSKRFLTEKNIPPETILKWLKSEGGHCDCEVIYNVILPMGDY